MAIWRQSLRIDYAAPGGPGYMTFHYRDDGAALTLAEFQAATDALDTAFTNLAAVLPTTTSIRGDGLWQEVNGPREFDTTGPVVVGTSTATGLLPGNVSLVLGWRTEDRGRSGRGRSFVSGFASAVPSDGTPPTNVLDAGRAVIASVVSYNATVANGAFVVYSRTQGIARDITGGAVRDVWGSLRSRRD